MGFLDLLKKLVPKSEPMPWDAQSVRHELFTLRLPEGWRFTRADWMSAKATGAAGQVAEFYFNFQTEHAPETPQDIEHARPEAFKLMQGLVKHDAQMKSVPTQKVLPNGLLWTEASEVRGAEEVFVIYMINMQARTAQHAARMAQFTARTAMPVSSGGFGAERMEALRGALRNVEWI